jgi:glycosyltransferase involved in cell wall biosynthesis
MTTTNGARRYDLAVVIRGQGVGGSEQHTADLLNDLCARGVRLVLLQSGSDLRPLGLREVPGRLDVVETGLEVRGLSRSQLRSWARLLQDYPADRIYLAKPCYFLADLGLLQLLRKSARVVFHFEHSLPPPLVRPPSRRHFGIIPGLGLWWYRERWRRWLMGRQVDRVFAPSEAGKRELVKHALLPEDQITVCLNGLDAGRWVPDATKARAFRDRYGIPQDGYLFGAAGRLDPLKGLDLALRAFARLLQGGGEGARLCLVGKGPSRGQLEELARSLGLEGRVVFTGYVDDISEAYSAFDTLLFPSELESCPLVLLEAMGCGCRVVASPIGGVPELLGDPVCGELIFTRNPEDWADVMGRHLRTPAAERPALAARIRDYVVTNHDQRRQFELLADYFRTPVPSQPSLVRRVGGWAAGLVRRLLRPFGRRPAAVSAAAPNSPGDRVGQDDRCVACQPEQRRTGSSCTIPS